MVTISKRLEQIASKVTRGSRFADIGSDHALLPVYLVQADQIMRAVAGEVNRGPFEAAKRQVAAHRLEHRISVRLGDGLQVLEAGEVDSICIAGMGGGTIVQILTEGRSRLDGVSQLVLQPNVGEDLVRRWLVEQGWWLAEETILEEDGQIYEILAAERVGEADKRNRELYNPARYPHLPDLTGMELLEMGPYLLQRPEPAFVQKWEGEQDKLGRVLAQMSRSDSQEAVRKQEEVRQRIGRIREVLACLQKAHPSSR